MSLEGTVLVSRVDLEQIAQAIHQAYHEDGSWRTCGKLTCSRIAAMLSEPRYDTRTMRQRGPYGFQEQPATIPPRWDVEPAAQGERLDTTLR